MATHFDLRMSTRFEEEFADASALIYGAVVRRSRELQNCLVQRGAEWRSSYEDWMLRRVRDRQIVRLHLFDEPGRPAWRTYVDVDGDTLTWLAMGPHDLWLENDLSDAQLRSQIDDALARTKELIPDLRSRGRTLVAGDADDLGLRPVEIEDGWAFHLSNQQRKVEEQIWKSISGGVTSGTSFHLVNGGPGTGKTAIIAKLLVRLAGMKRKPIVRFDASSAVAEYLNQSLCLEAQEIDIAELRKQPVNEGGVPVRSDVVLVDDPNTMADIRAVMSQQQAGLIGHLIVSFDPLQLRDSVTDADFDRLARAGRATTYLLTDCYRQKSHVGATAKQFIDNIAVGAPFLRKDKIDNFHAERARVTAEANSIRFVNDGGYLVVYQGDIADDWDEYGEFLQEQRRLGLLWERVNPLLIVQEADAPVPADYEAAVDGIDYRYSPLDQIESIKGVDYQHVIMLIRGTTYDELVEGFGGKGKAAYNATRLLRIPLTRARDSLAIFVVR